MSYSIFEVKGGIGKNIMATAVAIDIKANYPKNELIVVSAYPAVWLNHPSVHRVITFDNLNYFHENYIKDLNSKIFISEPYNDEGFVYKKCHLVDSWRNQLGVKGGSTPILSLNQREKEFYSNQIKTDDRKILCVQTTGGSGNQKSKFSWLRDIPTGIAQEVVNHYAQQNYRVIHVRREDQLQLQNVEVFTSESIKDIFGLIQCSDKRFFMDSFCQHAAFALGLQSVVLWPVDNITILGYNFHKNIVSKAKRNHMPDIFGYLNQYDITGNLTQYDFEEGQDIFKVSAIIKSLDK